MSKHDGGPAFPSLSVDTEYDTDSREYSGRVFSQGESPGMSLRQWYAGLAMSGLTADSTRGGGYEDYAKDAYGFADAMLAHEEAEA